MMHTTCHSLVTVICDDDMSAGLQDRRCSLQNNLGGYSTVKEHWEVVVMYALRRGMCVLTSHSKAVAVVRTTSQVNMPRHNSTVINSLPWSQFVHEAFLLQKKSAG